METREIEYNGTSHIIAHGEYAEGVTSDSFDESVTYYADDTEFSLSEHDLIDLLAHQGVIF